MSTLEQALFLLYNLLSDKKPEAVSHSFNGRGDIMTIDLLLILLIIILTIKIDIKK